MLHVCMPLSGSKRRGWRLVGRHNAGAHARNEHPLCRTLYADSRVPPARAVFHRRESSSFHRAHFLRATAHAPFDRLLCLPRHLCILSRKVLKGALLQQLIKQQNVKNNIICQACGHLA